MHQAAAFRDDTTTRPSPPVPDEPARHNGQGNGGSPGGHWYGTVARYRTFLEARQAVDHLHDNGFPEPSVTIVGRDLEGHDKTTRSLVGWRATGKAALAAAAVGALIGWLINIIVGTGAFVDYVVLAGAWIGAMLGAVAGFARHTFATYRQDLTAIGGVTAETYHVQVDRQHAHAERLLARYWPM